MTKPYAINCTDGHGIRQPHLAEGYIISPGGIRIQAMCRSCAQVCIDEYREKQRREWAFELQDWEVPPINLQIEGIGLHQLRELGTKVE